MPSITEIKSKISEHCLEIGSESYNRKLLIEGLEIIKKKNEYNQRLKEYGSVGAVDVNDMNGWVNNFVRDTLEGSINASKGIIYWENSDGRIEYNPGTGEVTKC